jgi:ParB/RepB/Spo0J family partition protein
MDIQNVALNKIKLGKNSRLNISEDELSGLMQSIKETGLLQPIGVVQKGKHYSISYGNRRFLAASKLGWSAIPAIILNDDDATSDLKNLTENIQRKSISLAEAGRYCTLLKKQGLSHKEIAARMGVSLGYIGTAVEAYNEIPKKFQKHVVGQMPGSQVEPGKISFSATKAIINASKSYGLNDKQKEKLLWAAKTEEKFLPENALRYAQALKSGNDDFLESTEGLKQMAVRFFITESHYEELQEKYVTNGPYKSLMGLMVDVLSGKKAVRIQVAKRNKKTDKFVA